MTSLRGWRIVKDRYRQTAFSGDGAELYGGRWNTPGKPVIYASDSVALAMLEILAHIGPSDLRASYRLCRVEVSRDLIEVCEPADVAATWRTPGSVSELQQFGDRWVQAQRSAALKVRSAIVPQEWNLLLNPRHPDFSRVACELDDEFQIDPRILKS